MNAFTQFRNSTVYDGPMPPLTEQQKTDAAWYKAHGWEIVKATLEKVGNVIRIVFRNKEDNKKSTTDPQHGEVAMNGEDVKYFYAEWLNGQWMCFEDAPQQDW